MSLQTKEPREARYLRAQMDASAATLFASPDMHAITADQLNRIFRTAFEQHRAKQRLAFDIDRSNGCADLESTLSGDRVFGHAYGVLARKGVGAVLDETDRSRLTEQGLAIGEVDEVDAVLRSMKGTKVKPSVARMTRLLEAVGVEPNSSNLSTVQPYYLRAMGEALLSTAEAYDHWSVPQAEVAPNGDGSKGLHAMQERARLAEVTAEPIVSDSQPAPPASDVKAVPETAKGSPTIAALSKRMTAERIKSKRWDDKAGRQAEFIYTLFASFLKERFSVESFESLEQRQLFDFASFLKLLPKTYGKSPHHKSMTIDAIVRWSGTLPSDKTGAAPATLNRHLTFLGQLLPYAKGAGVKFDRDLSFSSFREAKRGRARDDRPIPKGDSFDRFFTLPIFTGCQDWDRKRHEPGEHVYHRAAYFGPMIAFYTGMRREEFCGLAVEDLVVDCDQPHFSVAANTLRRIKNVQSKRFLAIHPELIRLGLLDYRKALVSLGHERLFPDLYSGKPKQSLGDRLYDELLPGLRAAGFTPHQVRHFFNSALKRSRVSAEMRADMMGHAGTSETTERYVDAHDLSAQLEDLAKLPTVTALLAVHPIRLLPWVERKEQAPWARTKPHMGRSPGGRQQNLKRRRP